MPSFSVPSSDNLPSKVNSSLKYPNTILSDSIKLIIKAIQVIQVKINNTQNDTENVELNNVVNKLEYIINKLIKINNRFDNRKLIFDRGSLKPKNMKYVKRLQKKSQKNKYQKKRKKSKKVKTKRRRSKRN